jgi:hypothetical protein
MTDIEDMEQRRASRVIEARKVRDSLIGRCDWTHTISDWDIPQKEEWRLYRASLRDIPLHPLFPEMHHNNDEYPRPPNNPAQIVQHYIYDELSEEKWVVNPEWTEPEALAEEPALE